MINFLIKLKNIFFSKNPLRNISKGNLRDMITCTLFMEKEEREDDLYDFYDVWTKYFKE